MFLSVLHSLLLSLAWRSTLLAYKSAYDLKPSMWAYLSMREQELRALQAFQPERCCIRDQEMATL